MKLLFVASDRREFAGLLTHVAQVRPAGLAVDWSRAGRLGGNDVLLVANGVGWKRAAAAVDAAAGGFRPDAVVSMGFCGALDERLEIADVVVATSIVAQAFLPVSPTYTGKNACATATGKNACAIVGPICSIDHVAATAAEKRALRDSGAIAVEMEAAGVAQRAEALQLPFYCVKAVTDLAGESMANDFNSALRSDGHFDTISVFKGTLRHPTIRIPELIRLRKRCARAARELGEFLADCRF